MKVGAVIVSLFVSRVISILTDVHAVHERRDSLSPDSRWVKRAAVHDARRIPVRIALKQSNEDKGHEYLMKVSDPDSPTYGQHYTPQQVANLFAPSEHTVRSVTEWLVGSGIPADSISLSSSKGWLHFETTAGSLGSMLKTKYHMYNHATSEDASLGADEYSVPQHLSSHIDLILPGTTLLKMQKRTTKSLIAPFPVAEKISKSIVNDPNSLDNCDEYVTPACIRALYQIPKGKLANPKNKMGIFQTAEELYSQADLDQFYAAVELSIPKGTGPLNTAINNTPTNATQEDAADEPDLDFEMAIPIIYPQQSHLLQVEYPGDGYEGFDPVFADMIDAFKGPYCHDNGHEGTFRECQTIDAPNVISISYGADEELSILNFWKRQCVEWMKLGMAGTTVFVASGDNGASSGRCLGSDEKMFAPSGTPSCPYITAVGGTTLPEGSKVGDPEVATSRFSSGGGFSNIFPTPDWQVDAVSGYLANHNPGYKSYNTTDGKIPNNSSHGLYNRGGRAFPDISAAADNGVCVTNGKQLRNGGTSMSYPIVAAMFNRINEERIHSGKGTVGWINPALYKADRGIYNDVVSGDQSHGGCGTKGFPAAPGWDPVTGLGTPKYPKMLEYFVNL